MRKIDKSVILSKNYEKWLQSLDKEQHPEYNSSANKYYFDIKMSLLYCQGGLCAYSEQFLCDPKFLTLDKWNDDKYIGEIDKKKKPIKGDLEHFDESLKKTHAWLWDNLFIAEKHINCVVKGQKPIKPILKPDSKEYDPFKYLELYLSDEEDNIYSFKANSNLSETEQEEVEYMIDTLGLNCIEDERSRQLREWKDKYEIGLPIDPYRFVTAWKMTLENLEKSKI